MSRFSEKFFAAASDGFQHIMFRTADGFLIGALIAGITIGLSKLPANDYEAALPAQEEPKVSIELSDTQALKMDVSDAAAWLTLGLYSSAGGFLGLGVGAVGGLGRARKTFKSFDNKPV